MTRDDVLACLLAAADDDARVFDLAEVATWAQGVFEQVHSSGIVRAAQTGMTAPCPGCDQAHVETVAVVDGPRGPRYFVPCPESLRVEVTADMCCGWEVDRGRLAAIVARLIGAKGSPKEVVRDRLWRLGRVVIGGTSREFLLACRLDANDAGSVTRHIGSRGRFVLLVPSRLPVESAWTHAAPPTVALTDVTSLVPGGLEVDGVALVNLITGAEEAASKREAPTAHVEFKQVRKHVRAVVAEMVTNEALVNAYRENGSYDKAAAALNRQGFATNRWAVARAVRGAGGWKKLRQSQDSASVSRNVASQTSDISKKMAMYGKSAPHR